MVPDVARAATEADQVLATAARAGVEFVDLQFTDLFGMIKSVSIPIEHAALDENGQVFTGQHDMDGFFYALLEKRAGS